MILATNIEMCVVCEIDVGNREPFFAVVSFVLTRRPLFGDLPEQ